jgi:Zn-dependent M28 family amino/carboxypeptidase
VRLRLGCRTLPDVLSANVVADLRGRELPEEIVLIGAHLDSWDVGQGAIDDGAGCAIVMESLRLLRSLGLVPRRTIRGVLFMNEENGLRGARAYAESHAHELGRHVAAIESDLGGARPLGFTALTGAGGEDRLREITALLRGLGADAVTPGGQGGADLTPLRPARVPLLGLRQDAIRYFDWHHTEADTLDKVDPRELAQNAAAMAVVAYVLADMPETLPRPDPQPQPVGRR